MDLPASGGTAAMIIYIWIYLPHGDTLENRAFISELQCIIDINVDLPALGESL